MDSIMKRILLIDGQGGKMGRQMAESLLSRFPTANLTVVGTNSMATASMLKAGVKQAATGENAVLVACRRADIIVGPIGLVVADAMLGEITPAMALAVAQSDALKILLPLNRCDILIAGIRNVSMTELIQDALDKIQTAWDTL